MNSRHTGSALALLTVCALSACGSGDAEAMDVPQDPPNTLTAAERAEGWQLLFDGTSTEAWRTYGQDALHDGWQAVDGMEAPSVTNRLGTSWAWFHLFKTEVFGSLPMRAVPISWIASPGAVVSNWS